MNSTISTRPGRLGRSPRAARFTRFTLAGALVAALQFGLAGPSAAQEVQESLNVWFDVLFDENGQAKEVVPVDATSQSEGFWQQMTTRLLKAKVPPRQEDGRNASFRTGVVLYLNVDKVKSSVSIRSMQMMPIPIQLGYADYPQDAAGVAGWDGELKMVCRVGIDGTCVQATVEAPAGMPPSVHRFGRVSMAKWRFKPQQVNGKPVEGEFIVPMKLRTLDDQPVDFRDPRKL